jgi:hypothetical protein
MNTLTKWFTKSVTVKRLVDQGNQTEAMTTLGTLMCLIQEIDGNRKDMVAMGLFKPHRMYCDLASNLQDDDQVIDGTRIYTVKGTIRREQGNVTHLEVLLELGEAQV